MYLQFSRLLIETMQSFCLGKRTVQTLHILIGGQYDLLLEMLAHHQNH